MKFRNRLIVVVLPAPFAPSRQKTSPGLIVRSSDRRPGSRRTSCVRSIASITARILDSRGSRPTISTAGDGHHDDRHRDAAGHRRERFIDVLNAGAAAYSAGVSVAASSTRGSKVRPPLLLKRRGLGAEVIEPRRARARHVQQHPLRDHRRRQHAEPRRQPPLPLQLGVERRLDRLQALGDSAGRAPPAATRTGASLPCRRCRWSDDPAGTARAAGCPARSPPAWPRAPARPLRRATASGSESRSAGSRTTARRRRTAARCRRASSALAGALRPRALTTSAMPCQIAP